MHDTIKYHETHSLKSNTVMPAGSEDAPQQEEERDGGRDRNRGEGGKRKTVLQMRL